MKKTLFLAVALIMAGLASAQKVMKIEKNDGSIVEVKTADIKEVTFGDPSPIYVGDWVVNSVEYTPDEMNNDVWYGMIESGFNGWPTLNINDSFTITSKGMSTILYSEFKNYFNTYSDLKPIDSYTIHTGVGATVTLTMVELSNVNRYFSADQTSEDTVAQLGFAVNPDDEDMLDVYIIDYDSRSFAYPDFDDWGMYSPTKPTATMSAVYCKFTLERAK